MSTLLDIGTILKEAVYDVHSLSFSVNQEQAAQQNVIKAMQTAYGQALGLGSIKEIDTNYRDWETEDRKSTRLNSSHITRSRMPASA